MIIGYGLLIINCSNNNNKWSIPISQLNMPDRRIHRGPHPQDAKLFAPSAVKNIQAAVVDYSLLLSRGYAGKSTLKLVGDRFSLACRQRMAVMRSACSDEQLVIRRKHEVEVTDLTDNQIAIDGYNILITIEAALSGAIVLKGRDGCFRDLASIHGTYRKGTETIPAIQLKGDFLSRINVGGAVWYLDRPVSNSGRLKKIIED